MFKSFYTPACCAAFVASVLLAFFQYRSIPIGFFAAIPVCVLATELIGRKLNDKFKNNSIIAPAAQMVSVVLLSTMVWAFAGDFVTTKFASASPATTTTQDVETSNRTCFGQNDYKVLASLPAGHVISDLNSASPILVFTNNSVVSGPYHRNQQGILDILDFFDTNLKKAREIAERHKVDYVAFCKSGNKRAKTLRSRLNASNPPAWLKQLSSPSDSLLVFRLIE